MADEGATGAGRDPANHLSSMDARINDRGFFERILKEREALELERIERINDRFDSLDKALKLQADEYERRLHDLNGEYSRDRQRQHDYVTVDKYEDRLRAEASARVIALERVDEKFQEYVKRYEVRQREVDVILAAQKGAAEHALRAAEEQGRKSTKNLAIASLALGLLVFAANFLPSLLGS